MSLHGKCFECTFAEECQQFKLLYSFGSLTRMEIVVDWCPYYEEFIALDPMRFANTSIFDKKGRKFKTVVVKADD